MLLADIIYCFVDIYFKRVVENIQVFFYKAECVEIYLIPYLQKYKYVLELLFIYLFKFYIHKKKYIGGLNVIGILYQST